jgi:predicted AlkP superfamily pyrophosphatase or phosphodiesterase
MRRFALVLLALFVFTGGCTSKPERAVVVWMSIDGLRPDYVERANAPLLQRLVREGASTGKLSPPTPSLTFPSHISQATGVPPGVHGIVGNAFYDTATRQRYSFPSDPAMLQAEPIWITAKRQGIRTLVYDWPLSYAQTGPVRDDYFLDKFDSEPTDRQRLDRVLDTWRRDTNGQPLQLLMAYVKQPDVVGHKFGPDSPEILTAVAETDHNLQHFVDEAEKIFRSKHVREGQLYILLTSDHGMAPEQTMVNLEKLFDSPPPPRTVQRISNGTSAMLYLDQVPESERDALREKMLRDLGRRDFLTVYTRDTLPKQWGLAHPTRTGDIIVMLRPGYHFSDRLPLTTFPREKVEASRGAHGYIPADCAEMNAFCVIWRYPDRMKRRDLGKVNVEQVHPTIARLLNIKPADAVKAEALP